MDYNRIRRDFNKYMKKVVKNASIDYIRKYMKSAENEISVEDLAISQKKLLSYDDSFFLSENDNLHSNIEDRFTDEKHHKAVKALSDKEKEVFYLTAVEKKTSAEVAKMLNTTEDNINQIKSRARKKAINNLKNEK